MVMLQTTNNLRHLPTQNWQPGNKVRILQNGHEAYPAMLKAITHASQRVWLANYSQVNGEVYADFQRALVAAAHRGVDVRVLIDAHGSDAPNKTQAQELRAAGAHVVRFRPLSWLAPWTYNKRLHKKLLIIDDADCFSGGVGLADFWARPWGPYPKAWRDTHFLITGPAVSAFASSFALPWNRFCERAQKLPISSEPVTNSAGKTPIAVIDSPTSTFAAAAARAELLRWIDSASTRLDIVTAYYGPDETVFNCLIAAAQRGVAVRLICNGPYSTHAIAQRSGQVRYRKFVEAGGNIYEYLPTKIHAKLMLVDVRYTIAGSPNINMRSSYHDEEIVISIDDKTVTSQLEREFERDLKNCRHITLQNLSEHRNGYETGNRLRHLLRYFF